MTEHVDGIVVVPEKSRSFLSERQLLDYRSHRKGLIRWMFAVIFESPTGSNFKRSGRIFELMLTYISIIFSIASADASSALGWNRLQKAFMPSNYI